MDQIRQVGEVLGSIKALMVLKDDIPINQRQCCLLYDIFNLAFETIGEEMRRNLRLEEKNIKWKSLEHPMRELHRIFKEGELYIRNCLDIRDWSGKAIVLHHNKDCVEFHIHNLLCCFPIVIEAIETAGEISGLDPEDMQKRRQILMKKYCDGGGDGIDAKVFGWVHGKQYLVPRDICHRMDTVWREDRWLLQEAIQEKKASVMFNTALTKHEQRIGDFLLQKRLNGGGSQQKMLPSWVLTGAKDYHVKRRLGSGSHFKEIHWMGECFAMRHFFGEIEPVDTEISLLMSLSHPSIMQYHCGLYDEEKKEVFIVMELMQKNLSAYVKENCSQRRRILFSLPVAVDLMLQIARGMEYLHSLKIYHGDLNPSNILLKARNYSSTEGYLCAKIAGFGLTPIKSYISRCSPSNQNETNPVIWYAPEVLADQEQKPGGSKSSSNSKCTEKADVYSFGMLCFQLLTGKIPFEDAHLQEDKMGRNIRAGERPLFPFITPKSLANLTKKCWQNDPTGRPSFSAICRILRYIKKCLVINPDHGQPESAPPLVDVYDIEAGYSKKFLEGDSEDLGGGGGVMAVSRVPFQMFAYRLVEKDKTCGYKGGKAGWDLGNEAGFTGPGSLWGDDNGIGGTEDPFLAAIDQRSVYSEVQERKSSSRVGMDRRSVCSEAPLRRIFSTNALDKRTMYSSENPWRKMDQMSVASEAASDGKFMLPAPTAENQMRLGSETPELKTFLRAAAYQSINFEIPENKILPSPTAAAAADQKSVCSEIVERSAATNVDQKPVKSSEMIPKKKPLSKTTIDQKLVSSSEIPEKRALTRTRSTDQKSVFSQIMEKKVLSPIAADQMSVRSEVPKKKTAPKKASDTKSVHSETPEKKVIPKKKLTNPKIIKNTTAGTENGKLPRQSSLTVMPKLDALRSSPSRSPSTLMNPTGMPKLDALKSSPSRSPSRLMSPCNRCSRLTREHQLSSFMTSPNRHGRRGEVSDSDIA